MKPHGVLFAAVATLTACIETPTDVPTESVAEQLSRKVVWDQLTGKVAFSAKCGRYQICMYVADATTRTVREISSPAERADGVSSISWAPDGTRVLFGASHGGTSFRFSIWSASINGGAVSYVLSINDWVSHPSVSSSGELAYVRWGYPSLNRLCILNQQCLPERPYETARAAWAPDGQALVFVIKSGENRSSLAMARPVAAATTTPIVPADATGIISATAPAFSPDGLRIAFVARLSSGAPWQIWTMNTDGSDARRVIDAEANSDPAWSPDGTAVLYAGARGIMRANVDGTNASTVLEDNRVGQLAWRP